MKFGIQSRENTLVLNMLFGIDDLVPNFMKFGTKNKWNILIDILLSNRS